MLLFFFVTLVCRRQSRWAADLILYTEVLIKQFYIADRPHVIVLRWPYVLEQDVASSINPPEEMHRSHCI